MLEEILHNFWIFLTISVLTGAWTGYITNDLAIKMLFKEYKIGKLKFGGVILRSRGNLEHSIGELVEREIINDKTIRKQLKKLGVRKSIKRIVQQFFSESVYKHTDNVALKDIKGYEETKENILNFVEKFLHEHLTDTFLELSKHINLDDLLTKKQINKISKVLSKELVNALKENNLIGDLMINFYEKYNYKTIDDLLGEEIINIIMDNIGDILDDLFEQLKFKYSRQVEVYINKIYQEVDLKTIIKDVEVSIKNRKFKDFISDESLDDFIEIIDDYVNSDHSMDAVKILCEGIFVALKEINKPIIELFTGDLRSVIEEFFETQLPDIIDKLVDLVRDNSGDIEVLIESAIDQTISDQGAFKRAILSGIRIFLIENFTQRYNIINKMVNMLENIDIEDVSKTISNQIVNILHEKNVSDIIFELENNDLLTSDIISTQIHRSVVYLSNHIFSRDREYKDFLNKEIGKVITFDFEAIFNQSTVSYLTKQMIYNKGIFNIFKTRIINIVREYTKLPIKEYLNDELAEKITRRINDAVVVYVDSKSDVIEDVVYSSIERLISSRNVSEILDIKNANFESEMIVTAITNSVENLLNKYNKTKVYDIYNKLNKVENLGPNVVDSILEFLENGLDVLLKGNVSKVVENNIKQFDNDQVLDMMQEFMGTKLRPLTVLGAVFGTIIGFVLAVTGAGFQDIWLTIPVYAVLGYLTNVMALFFIFRPYKPLFGIKGAQGIIIKQIPVFAKSVGNVVSNNLLSQEIISTTIFEQEEVIKDQFIDFIKKDNYRLLREFLVDRNNVISKQLQEVLLKYLKKNQKQLINNFVSDVFNFDIDQLNSDIISNLVSDITISNVEMFTDVYVNQINTSFKTSNRINDVLSSFKNFNIEDKIDKAIEEEIIKLAEVIKNENYLSKKLYEKRNKINPIFERPIGEILNDQIKSKVKEQIHHEVYNVLFTDKGQNSVSNYINRQLHDVFAKSKNINDMFGGKFIPIANDNMSKILYGIGNKVVEWIQLNKFDIFSKTRDKVREDMNSWLSMGYTVMSGDSLVQETVYRLIDDKLPVFINEKISHLNKEIEKFFVDLGSLDLESINVEFEETGINDYIKQVFTSEEIHIKTQRFVSSVMDYFFKLETNRFFNLLKIYSIHDILMIFDDELKTINKDVYNNLLVNKDKISYTSMLFVNQFLTKEILTSKVRNLTLGIEEEHLRPFVQNFIELIKDDNFLQDHTFTFVEHLISNLKQYEVTEMLDEAQLSKDLNIITKSLLSNEDFHNSLYNVISNISGNVSKDIHEIIDESNKEFIIQALTNSLFEVMRDNVAELIEAIDLKEVTENEINSMDPRKIKELFDSFAGKYFRKLETYGLMGGIFALPPVIFISFIYVSIGNLKHHSATS